MDYLVNSMLYCFHCCLKTQLSFEEIFLKIKSIYLVVQLSFLVLLISWYSFKFPYGFFFHLLENFL